MSEGTVRIEKICKCDLDYDLEKKRANNLLLLETEWQKKIKECILDDVTGDRIFEQHDEEKVGKRLQEKINEKTSNFFSSEEWNSAWVKKHIKIIRVALVLTGIQQELLEFRERECIRELECRELGSFDDIIKENYGESEGLELGEIKAWFKGLEKFSGELAKYINLDHILKKEIKGIDPSTYDSVSVKVDRIKGEIKLAFCQALTSIISLEEECALKELESILQEQNRNLSEQWAPIVRDDQRRVIGLSISLGFLDGNLDLATIVRDTEQVVYFIRASDPVHVKTLDLEEDNYFITMCIPNEKKGIYDFFPFGIGMREDKQRKIEEAMIMGFAKAGVASDRIKIRYSQKEKYAPIKPYLREEYFGLFLKGCFEKSR